MSKPTARQFTAGLWALGIVVSLISLTTWSTLRDNSPLTAYAFFPLLGLLAFGLMWSHYIGGALRLYWGLPKGDTQNYFTYTSWIVLGLILLHPGILVSQLYADGFGLPPASYLNVYGGGVARVALLLGTVSLGAFLLFELHRVFSTAGWWKYVEYLNIAAMGAIFYHGLTLGGELNSGWFRALWFAYGLTFLAAISYSYIHRKRGGYGHEE